MLAHTYFICDKEKEPDRYKSISDQITSLNIENYTFFKYIWGSEVTPELRQQYCKSDTCMRFQGRCHPLLNTEISLFLNHIECLRDIRKNYTTGYFAIYESDVLFYKDYHKNIEEILHQSKEYDNIHIINIGEGCGQTPTSMPIKPFLSLYKEKTNKFTEGIIWTYDGVCNFLDYFDKTTDIDGPIDTKIHIYSEIIGGFNIYWAIPSIVYQGSISGKFMSIIR